MALYTEKIKDPTGQELFVGGATPQDVNSAITAASLAPSPTFNPVQPDQTPIAPVAGLNAEVTPLAPLPQETQQSDLIKQLQGLTMETTGEAGFRAEQEKIQGIPELQKTQSDLSARLKTLQNEALAIPLQLQQEATGRGITTGGLQPIQTAALRNNAIQALSVSSLLEASRGNLTTAQSLADRAVAQKYDPIKAEINAKLANLELLSKDPTLTLAQKNRLDAQKAIQDAKLAQAAQAEAFYKEVQKIAVDAAGNSQNFVPTGQFRTLAQALEAMQSSDPQTALQIAASVGLTGADPLDRQLKQLQIQKAQQDLGGGVRSGISPVTGKPYTEIQTKSATFAERMKQAEDTLTLGKQFRDIAPLQFLKSDERRQFEQAAKNFVTAVLRKESGAAIAESEFEDAAKIYIPQFGDDDATLEQKAESRRIAFEGMIRDSAGAYSGTTAVPQIPTTTASGKPFNYQAAKAAGYSDEEITAFINGN